MKSVGIWILISLPLVLASESAFSVNDDLLAFPPYEIVFSDTVVLDSNLNSKLVLTATTPPEDPPLTSTLLNGVTQSNGQVSPRNPGINDDQAARSSFESNPSIEKYESMMLNYKPYLCAIPLVNVKPINETSELSARVAQEAELLRATSRGWNLLRDLEGRCLYWADGWWTYSFCHNSQIRQFHQLPTQKSTPLIPPTEDPATPAYVLGKVQSGKHNKKSDKALKGSPSEPNSFFQGAAAGTQLQAKGDLRYLVQKLDGGTTCDLTGKDRKIEVQYHCRPNSKDRIGWIKEITTCNYLMAIYTAKLCEDVAFLPPLETKGHSISCQQVLSADQVSDWKIRKSSELAAQLPNVRIGAIESPGEHKAKPIIVLGGIKVGAHLHVGAEGNRIEPGSLAGGVIPTVIVATSRGKQISKEELKEIGLDPEVVEKHRKKIESTAAGKDWKLEVFENKDGDREIRGVVFSPDDAEESNDERSEEYFKE
ncbi:MAG: Endoplasmic reticulum lectin 1 [Trizodia sp. TS-e1964]|nr:MAG: Endoplasmic reticulum lectin 1 [Trizodia sp. TS-e1964]